MRLSVRRRAWCACGMRLRNVATSWLDGCRYLAAYDKIPGYRRLPWLARKRLDHQAVAMLLRSPLFWRAVFAIGGANVAMHVLAWHLDLNGAARDLLRALPLLVAFPWLVFARRGFIEALLRNRDTAHRQAGRDM